MNTVFSQIMEQIIRIGICKKVPVSVGLCVMCCTQTAQNSSRRNQEQSSYNVMREVMDSPSLGTTRFLSRPSKKVCLPFVHLCIQCIIIQVFKVPKYSRTLQPAGDADCYSVTHRWLGKNSGKNDFGVRV